MGVGLVSAALLTFTAILVTITLIGALSSVQSRGTPEDYLIASRSVGPWLTALSSVATNNSGFMFVGLIGFTYRGGLHTIWMAVAWILGDLLVWLFVHARVRELSGSLQAASVPVLLGADDRGEPQRAVVVGSAIVNRFHTSPHNAAGRRSAAAWVGRLVKAVKDVT